MEFKIRNFHPSDLIDLYRICLLTSDSGKDGTSKYNDPDIVGSFYAAPYAVLEPELCFVALTAGRVAGYIVGAKDTASFNQRAESEWFPPLREKYPFPEKEDISADARIIRFIHEGYTFKKELYEYPAHLHINLLPVAQGQGIGKKLISRLINTLNDFKVQALHLEVGKKNEGAIIFYERVGFHVIKDYENSIAFGMMIGQSHNSSVK